MLLDSYYGKGILYPIRPLIPWEAPGRDWSSPPTSPILRMCLGTDGSLVTLLGALFQRPCRFRILQQQVLPATLELSKYLGCPEGTALLARDVLLEWEGPGRFYAHAVLNLARSPKGLQETLLRGEGPVGGLLGQARDPVLREDLLVGRVAWVHQPPGGFPPSGGWSRIYRLRGAESHLEGAILEVLPDWEQGFFSFPGDFP